MLNTIRADVYAGSRSLQAHHVRLGGVMNKKVIIGIIVLTLTTLGMVFQEAEDSEDYPYLISLGDVSFSPIPGTIDVKRPGHFIIQFYEIPYFEQMEGFADLGIEIQRYIGGNAYIARFDRSWKAEELAVAGRGDVRVVIKITSNMRLHSSFIYSPRLQKAKQKNEAITIDVRFHPDVPYDRALEVMQGCAIECNPDRYMASNRLIAEASWPSIQQLINADEVDLIEPALLYYKLLNRSATKRMRVDQVLRRAEYHEPDGTGVLCGITDEWTVDPTHVEFGDRVTILHDTSYVETPTDWADLNHATSVAGNLAAGGIIKPKCRGPAPSAQILSMIIAYDPVNELKYAARNLGMKISSNSWGYDADTDILPPHRLPSVGAQKAEALQSKFGYYPNFNFATDQMINKTDVLIFYAAGNEAYSIVLLPLPDEMNNIRAPDKWHRTYPRFDTMLVNASAKNVLAIGATHKDDVICAFSSQGPGFNGRLGPHLVGPGFDMLTLASGDTYAHGSGTSGSCPMVAGVAALLIDQYRKIHQTDPSAELIKAVLINSARDLGPEGPDYTYGYGMVDAQLGARTISGQEDVNETDKVKSRFIEDRIKHKQEHIYAFEVPQDKDQLRVTLVWHDKPGRKLVNNLDLWAQYGNEKKILPLTLNPNDPRGPAVNKRTKRDTSEHIFIDTPKAGEWTIGVKGKKIPKGRQDYALVISASEGNDPPVKMTNGDFTIHKVVPSQGDVNTPVYSFNIGDPIYLHALLNVTDNASYEAGYYGTITVRFELWDESDTLVYVCSNSMHNIAPSTPGEYRDLLWREEEIPEGIQTGTFRVKTIVTMHNGITKVAPEELTISLQ